MTDDPRRPRPLFRIFDRDPDRHRPVDDDYVQERLVRVHRPGPWRTAFVVALALASAWAGLAAVVALTVAHTWPARIAVLIVVGLPVSALVFVTARVLAVGPYVNDRAFRQTRVLTLTEIDWPDIIDVRRVPGPVPLLGIGPSVPGERVLLVLRDGSELATTVTTHSPDFLGRAEAYDVAALGVERWWHDSRKADS
jgi:hypothetical protein